MNESALGAENWVLRATARRHQVQDFAGPLSIKSVIHGTVRWKTGRREIAVDERSFLILNDGEPYSMEIDSVEPLTTCCVFFRRGFVEEIYGSMCAADSGRAPVFLSFLQPRDDRILRRMKAIYQSGSRLWRNEQFLLLARDMLMLHSDVQRQIRRLPAVREATRIEAFKRLSRGREFMHGHFDEPLTLDRIARAACLSSYHFHRLFSRGFGESPHQYLTRIRLERARWLISRDDRPLVEICAGVGFESLGSFSTLFRRKFGRPPGAFRRSAK